MMHRQEGGGKGGFSSLLCGMGVRHRVQRVSMEAMGQRKRTTFGWRSLVLCC